MHIEKEVELYILPTYMVLYVDTTKESTCQKNPRAKKYSKITGYKISMQKLIVLLMHKWWMEKEIKIIPFTIALE